jgi:hypothetical protein
MKIVYVKAGNPQIEIRDVPSGLDTMKKLVGGYLELVRVTDEIDMWINEEGKLLELPPNFVLDYKGRTVDIIAGDAFFASNNEEGDTVSLTNELVEEIKDRFITREVFKIG